MKNRRRCLRLSSCQVILLAFLSVILLGAVALTLPLSARSGQWTGFANALFTATSAVCVTGLVVQDTATYWSIFGQVVILVLIQLGGLGIVTSVALLSSLSGRRLSLGLTPALGPLSHLILIALMFFGRVGTITVFCALQSRPGGEPSRYPVGKIAVGY